MKALRRGILSSLRKLSCLKNAEGMRNYFKEEIRPLGVKTPAVRRLASEFSRAHKELSREEIFSLAEELLSGHFEEGLFGLYLLPRTEKSWDGSEFPLIRKIAGRISNWAHCDEFSCHTINPFLCKFPGETGNVIGWAGASDKWLRRASAVSFVPSARRGQRAPQAFRVAGKLASDPEDIVQKGVGWLLKELLAGTGKAKVVSFLEKRRPPRLVCRIALEKLPPRERAEIISGIFSSR